MSVQYYEGIGRRKQSIARVRIMNGSGRFIVNDKEAPAYFNRLGDVDAILAVFKAVGQDAKSYDISVVVTGGGVTGQTDSVQLGLARAYVMAGDTVKAKATYQEFLTLWKDSDPDIPILKEAKAEYAKLQ